MGHWRIHLLSKQPCVIRRAPTRTRNEKGFTLIELTLVLGIAAILSTLAIPNYIGFLEKAKTARSVADLNNLAKEIWGYAIASGQYPDSLEQLGHSVWLDRWGNPYQYYRINCEVGIEITRHDDLESPVLRPAKLVIPDRVVPPDEAHVFSVLRVDRHQGLIHLAGNGGGNGGGGNDGGNGGGNGNGNGGSGSGKPRKDHFLHPINSDFDLYSMGADGESNAPLTAKQSRDDIIRANDGAYYGLASNF